jgi:hypothetical protein
MSVHSITIAAMAAALSLAVAAGPVAAQTTGQTNGQTTGQNTPTTTAKKKPNRAPPNDVAMNRPPTRVTVRRRSFLDPGTETKTHQEHFLDYAFPPGDQFSRFQNDYNFTSIRNPFPSCLDLAGFCR